MDALQAAIALLEKRGSSYQRELIARLCQLAQAQGQLRRPQLALEAYSRALKLAAGDPTAMRGQIELLDSLGKTSEATGRLEEFLRLHGESLDRAERAALHVRLGEMHHAQGNSDRAQAFAERALEMDGGHVGALRLLVAVCDKLAAFEKSVRYRQRLAMVAPESERFGLLFDLSVLSEEKLASPRRAIDGYLKALELEPKSKQVLQRLHVAYRNGGDNRKAIETLRTLLSLKDLSPAEWRRDTLVLAELVAVSTPTELDRAVAVLEGALDQDPTFLGALQQLEALLGKAKQWKKLDECYQRMIKRLGTSADSEGARATLWRALGELRFRREKDAPASLAAYDMGARLAPDDPAVQESFADLAMKFPDRQADAVAAYLRALSTPAVPMKLCAAAAQVAERAGDRDTCFLATRASQVLTTPHTPSLEPPRFRSPVSEPAWREHLLHPAVSPLGELMALIFEQAGDKFGANLKDFKLNPKKHAVAADAAAHPAIRQLRVIARGLGFEQVTVYCPFLAPQPAGRRDPHPDDRAGLRLVPTVPSSFVVGEKFLSEQDRGALFAMIGCNLAYLRPEIALPALMPPDELELTFEAALSLGDPSYVSSADPKLLKGPRKVLEKSFSANGRVGLQTVVAKIRRNARPGEFARYLDGARHTAVRAALLVAGDFAPVRASLIPEGTAGEVAMRELLRFALGGSLHALRVETGTATVT